VFRESRESTSVMYVSSGEGAQDWP
jgi:hypothetical protein